MIALFVDLENMYYPNLADLQLLARKYGGASEIKAYHHQQSADLWDEARIAGVTMIHPPSLHANKVSTDMVIASDLIEAGIYGKTEWVGLVSGDIDYLSALAVIKRRTDKKILVVARGGALSSRLRNVKDLVIDKLELQSPSSIADDKLGEIIITLMLSEKPSTVRHILNKIKKTEYSEARAKRVISSLRRCGVINLEVTKPFKENGVGQRNITTASLNEKHELVVEVKKDVAKALDKIRDKI